MGKIYIAGKITGTTDYLERFARAEEWLNQHGYQGMVINPAKISNGLPPESTTYKDYIHIGLQCWKLAMQYSCWKGGKKALVPRWNYSMP